MEKATHFTTFTWDKATVGTRGTKHGKTQRVRYPTIQSNCSSTHHARGIANEGRKNQGKRTVHNNIVRNIDCTVDLHDCDDVLIDWSVV